MIVKNRKNQMRNGRMGIVAAMEEEQSIAALQDIGLGNSASGVEVDLISIAELNAEFTSAEADTSNAVEVAEALESIAIALEASGQTLNKSGAQILNITLNSLYKSVGVVNKQSGIATESLDNKDCANYAKVALETIGDTVSKIWKAIVEAIKKSIEWVKEFFKKIFGANKKMEEKIKEAEEEIKKKEKEEPKEKSSSNQEKVNIYTAQYLFKNLAIDGKFPTNILNEIDNYEKLSTDLLVTIDDVLYNAFSDALKKLESDNVDLDKTFVFPKLNFGSVLKEINNRNTRADFFSFQSRISFGGIQITVNAPEHESKGLKALDNISLISVMAADVDNQEDNDEPMPYLTVDECKVIVSKLGKILNLIKIKTEKVQKIIDFKKKAMEIATDFYTRYNVDKDPSLSIYKHTDIGTIQDAVTSMAFKVDLINKKYLSKVVNINSAILKYVHVSMTNE